MPVSIDIDQQEASPFEQEPRLIGFYHWNRSIRTMHQHENCIELNFMISGNGTHIVGNEICHTQPGDIIIYDSKVMHDESLMLDSLTDACCIAVTGLKRPGARPNALLPPGLHPCIPLPATFSGIFSHRLFSRSSSFIMSSCTWTDLPKLSPPQ